ncbi:hypothetical protein PR202_ga28487 [Eleusine coracana subsp. coracana]|uniref:Uncharacterized protein n=1 Tax=Eleusine coracana subsp. coracana TaxID=191504 RepID=A0AAV5DIP1_ELECO|nr:hypothetical protein QOZ80_7AG0554230 [Eleusine coracana subsp. coracana]GJN10398.1 hypothetical protein PR202_ga28487 [Eleusine coracana subsp. coracana]
MGQCVSSGGAAIEASAAAAKATALVLLPTGELREYPRPATASLVLGDIIDSDSEGWFLCDSDRMGFEGAVAAVGGGEDLRAGRIYFVLPADARRRGLNREEVAALAVKASAALAARSSGNGRRRRGGAAVAPLVFYPTEEDDDEEETADMTHKAAGMKQRRPAARSRCTQQRRFAPDLTVIPECDMCE